LAMPGLGGLKPNAAGLGLLNRALDVDRAMLDIAPSEGEEFRASAAAAETKPRYRIEPTLEATQGRDLFGGQNLCLTLVQTCWLPCVGRVARYEFKAHRFLKGAPK